MGEGTPWNLKEPPSSASAFLGLTRQDEEDSRNEGQNGPLWADVADVADDEGGEHEEEADHGEGGGCAHGLWGRGETG